MFDFLSLPWSFQVSLKAPFYPLFQDLFICSSTTCFCVHLTCSTLGKVHPSPKASEVSLPPCPSSPCSHWSTYTLSFFEEQDQARFWLKSHALGSKAVAYRPQQSQHCIPQREAATPSAGFSFLVEAFELFSRGVRKYALYTDRD